MRETVLITGANSFIAKYLIPILEKKYTIKLLTRNPEHANEYAWDVTNKTIDEAALNDVNYIVHLAGSKLNDGSPLTEARKHIIRESRIGAADFLRTRLKERGQTLTAFISASAIGYYGFTDRALEIDETGKKGLGFNADLCDDWEKAADAFKSEQVADHVSKIRVSLVLGNDGGIFSTYKEMVAANPQIAQKPNSSSYPWNHVADMAGIFAFALENKLDGVYNSVAPEATSMQDIFKAIANESSGSSYSIVPFEGQHLVAHKIIEAGFQFKYPTIKLAVSNLLDRNDYLK